MMNQFERESRNSVIALTEEKFENKLTKEISYLREEMIRSDESLRVDIHKIGSTTIKWMFIFWIGQIGALFGILFAVFK